MKTFGWRAVSIALIIVFSDALVKGNLANFLPYYESPPTNLIYEKDSQFYETSRTKNVIPRNCMSRANLSLVFLGVNNVCCCFLFQALTPDNEATGRKLNTNAHSAYFIQNDFSYLNIKATGTSLVVQSIQCALTCLQHLSCFSFNLAAFPDDNGKLLCEHLLSDKYNNSKKFVSSKNYHHFSIWVSQNKGT